MEFLDTIEEDFEDLRTVGLGESFVELFLYRLEQALFDCVNLFLKDLDRCGDSANCAASCLADFLRRLHGPLKAGLQSMSTFLPPHLPAEHLNRSVRDLLRAILLAPADCARRKLLRPAAEGLFNVSFVLAHNQAASVTPEMRESLETVAAFCRTFDLKRPFVDEALEMFRERAREKIAEVCRDDFSTRHLKQLDTWADGLFGQETPWSILWTEGESSTLCRDQVRPVVRELYLKLRIEQLFAIIVDYPESSGAVHDVHECMQADGRSEWIQRHGRSALVSSLKSAMTSRVLHPGVNTKDLLVVYISTVRVLRLIDTTGVAQELVCAPIGEYLRSRSDVIREIIAKIIEDDGEGELVGELSSDNPGATFDGGGDSDADEDEAELMLQGRSDAELIGELVNPSWLSWRPDPVDACHHEGLSRRQADLLSMVVRIYGSKEMFVNEYRNLLATRLLNQLTFDTEREIRHLEMLKWRFEEQSLHECDVMLKDIHDSRRINSLVHEDLPPDTPQVSALILSAQFWPTFREDRLKLPAEWQQLLDRYTEVFRKLKGNRTLHWKPQLGTVSIEINFCGNLYNMEVNPVQAAILQKFSEQPRWSLQQLAEELDVHVSVLRMKVGMWVQNGFLVELRTDVYALAESINHPGGEEMQTGAVAADEAGVDASMPSAKDLREKEFAVFWAYIEHMLTNLGRLGLERIYNMLKMFVMGSSSVAQCSRDELKAFLDAKVREGSLTVHDEETYSFEKRS